MSFHKTADGKIKADSQPSSQQRLAAEQHPKSGPESLSKQKASSNPKPGNKKAAKTGSSERSNIGEPGLSGQKDKTRPQPLSKQISKDSLQSTGEQKTRSGSKRQTTQKSLTTAQTNKDKKGSQKGFPSNRDTVGTKTGSISKSAHGRANQGKVSPLNTKGTVFSDVILNQGAQTWTNFEINRLS